MGSNDLAQILTFQWKLGGWVALAGAALAAVIGWSELSIFTCPEALERTTLSGSTECASERIDAVAVLQWFGIVILGGALGVAVALALLRLGVHKDTLGVPDDD